MKINHVILYREIIAVCPDSLYTVWQNVGFLKAEVSIGYGYGWALNG